ncbi:MAG: hypothetical protein HY360_12565 [Verrucomicrobia bacterium]|nr:hypothetical protein [Verrucomicrobiota bacterium]
MWTIDSWYRESRARSEAQTAQCRGMAALFLKTLQDHLPGVPRDEIVRRLQKLNRERLDAVPDLNKYPELRGMRELVDAEWRGARDGAGLDDALWAAHCDQLYYYQRYVAAGKAGPIGCSYVYFPTSERGPILANNLDSSPEEPFAPPAWPALSEHLIIGNVSSGVFLDEDPPEIFPAPVYRLVGRYCRNTNEAVEMLQRYNYFWGPTNILVMDRQHHVAMIEKSSCRMGVRRSTDGFGFITAMTAQEPSMKSFLADRRAASVKARNLPANNTDVIYWRAQDRRAALMDDLLAEARNNPTVEGLRRIIQFRSPERGNVCGNGDPLFPGGPPTEHTLKTTIWLLKDGRAMWWAREGAKPSFENRKLDIEFKDVWRWD